MRYLKLIFIFIFLVVFCIILSVGVSHSYELKTVVAVDASTSMRGFFSTGEINKLIKNLQNAISISSIEVVCYKYHRENGKISGGEFDFSESDFADGQITLLNKCFTSIRKNHPDAGIVYLITDNVQDAEGSEEEQGDIEKLYSQLRSSDVEWLHIFPLQLEFKGPLFKRDGFTRLTNSYSGKRGLIVYSILLDKNAKSSYSEQIKSFGKEINFKGINAKLVKGETVSVFPIEVELVKSDSSDKNQLKVVDNELVPARDRPFSEGEQIVGKFSIGIKSKLNYVTIDSSKVRVELSENFKFFGLGSESSDFRADNPVVIWDPMILTHAIVPGDFDTGELPKVRVELQFDKGVRFNKSIGALFRYIQKSEAGDFRGRLSVTLGVQSNHVRLVDAVLDRYSISSHQYFDNSNETVQSKILNLDKLFKETIDFADIVAQEYPIHFKVNYPSWPLFILIFLIIVIVVIIYLLLTKRSQYKVVDFGDGRYEFEYVKKKQQSSEVNNYYDDGTASSSLDSFDNSLDENYSESKFKLLPFIGNHAIYLEGLKAANIMLIPFYGIILKARKNFIIDEGKKTIVLDPNSGTNFSIDKKNIEEFDSETYSENMRNSYSSGQNENYGEADDDIGSKFKDHNKPIDDNDPYDYPE